MEICRRMSESRYREALPWGFVSLHVEAKFCVHVVCVRVDMVSLVLL
jgi:hypothetical protein